METFITLHPTLQALIATGFTWLLTALGAAAVFFFRSIAASWMACSASPPA